MGSRWTTAALCRCLGTYTDFSSWTTLQNIDFWKPTIRIYWKSSEHPHWTNMDEPQWCPQTEYTKTINDDLVAVSFHCPSYPAFLMGKTPNRSSISVSAKITLKCFRGLYWSTGRRVIWDACKCWIKISVGSFWFHFLQPATDKPATGCFSNGNWTFRDLIEVKTSGRTDMDRQMMVLPALWWLS